MRFSQIYFRKRKSARDKINFERSFFLILRAIVLFTSLNPLKVPFASQIAFWTRE